MNKEIIITDTIIKYIHDWLGTDGIQWFKSLKDNFGTVSPVIPINHKLNPDKIIPHPVHFREGMQIRNKLRSHPDCSDWDDHDFDNNWIKIIDSIINRSSK